MAQAHDRMPCTSDVARLKQSGSRGQDESTRLLDSAESVLSAVEGLHPGYTLLDRKADGAIWGTEQALNQAQTLAPLYREHMRLHSGSRGKPKEKEGAMQIIDVDSHITVVKGLEGTPFQHKRVVVMGTGGISHWVGPPETGKVNAEFDRWFLQCLVEGKSAEVIEKYKKAEELEKTAGNGGQEIRDWLAVAGAMPSRLKPRVLAYEPIPQWATGTGVMAWA